MHKWYRTKACKGILIVCMHLFVVAIIICLSLVLSYPGRDTQELLLQEDASDYTQSNSFSLEMQSKASQILNIISYAKLYGTDGKFDGDKEIDITTFGTDSQGDAEEATGILYKLSELQKWSEEYAEYGYDGEQIIVCQKPDGTFQYYYIEEFEELMESGTLVFSDVEEADAAYYLEELQGDMVARGSSLGIEDKKGKVLYTDCWNFSAYGIEERYAPVGYDNILEVVNEDENWNGRLQEVLEDLHTVLQNLYGSVADYEAGYSALMEGNTNLTYLLLDREQEILYSNKTDFTSYKDAESYIAEIKSSPNSKYVVINPKRADCEANVPLDEENWQELLSDTAVVSGDYTFVLAVDDTYPIQDSFYKGNEYYSQYAPLVRPAVFVGALCGFGFVIGLIWLTVVAGRTSREEELHLVAFDTWKTEIAAVVLLGAWALLNISVVGVGESGYIEEMRTSSGFPVIQTIYYSVLGTIFCAAFLTGFLTLVRRIKAKVLWKNSLCYLLFDTVRDVFRNRSNIVKTIISAIGFLLLQLLLLSENGFIIFLVVLADLAIFVYLLWSAAAKTKITRGIERIAAGDLAYKIPTGKLRGDYLHMAEKINMISEGLNKAVEANMKSERMKTELITNVSHDIKTPLTSIINYVDLLKRENLQDPKTQGYIAVLEAKAQRLKSLTEDIIEASKISSGNIELEYMNINLVEMIQQTTGEFQEKFDERQLTTILTLPQEPVYIRVDGKRMWRILENIYNNAAKYALTGTRVYADMSVDALQVSFSLKNISEQPLNITEEELTERFIRGDVSRTTEGSGLGLSIAKSLTQMQNGEFQLYLDGDLFKVTLIFPRAVQNAAQKMPQETEASDML
ncbi:MAG: sensor histidine kinase [Lachnospiraceae bacterium]